MVAPAQLLNRILSRTTAIRAADRQRIGQEIGGCVLTWVFGSISEVASIPMWSRHSFDIYPTAGSPVAAPQTAADATALELNSLLGGYGEDRPSGEAQAELKAAIGQGQGKWRALRSTSGIDPSMLLGHRPGTVR